MRAEPLIRVEIRIPLDQSDAQPTTGKEYCGRTTGDTGPDDCHIILPVRWHAEIYTASLSVEPAQTDIDIYFKGSTLRCIAWIK